MAYSRVSKPVLVLLLLGAIAACTKTDSPDSLAPGQTAGKLGSDKPIRLESGTITVKQKEDVSVVRAADEALAGKEVDQKTLLRLARRAERAGQPAFAAGFYSKALQDDPKNPALLKKFGFALFEAGRLKRAQTVFERARAASPDDPEILRGIGNVQVSSGNPEAAIATYRRALEKDSGRHRDYRIYNGLGVALDMTGDHEGARRAYRLGMASSPSNPSLRNNMALSLAASARYAEALRILRGLVAEDGDNPKHRRNLRRVRRMATKAGVKVPRQTSLRPAPSDPGVTVARRSRRAARPEQAEPARRMTVDRPAGRPRRLVPESPASKGPATATRKRRQDRNRDTAVQTASRPAQPRAAGTDDARTAERNRRPGREAEPGDLARLAPAGGDPEGVADEAGVSADRAFLQTWNGGIASAARRTAVAPRRLVRITPQARPRSARPAPRMNPGRKPESAPVK